MAKEKQLFLKRLCQAWKKEFPFLRPVDLDEVPKMPKNSNYRCDDYFAARGVCYFVSIDFSENRHGEFWVTVTTSPSREKSILHPSVYNPPSPTNVGSFNISEFFSRSSFRWDIVDVDSRMNANLKDLGIPIITMPDYVKTDLWQPSSYAVPFKQIAEEAICDLSEKLKRHVFPKLAIDVEDLRSRQ